ncbi:putative DNA repair endonuclease rad2 [Tilletiaria anomala UBC 951]|uniref:Flap endonuclease 1 n=1 Tax=Tilletiaria anomala (strain ATCC 24038 / CBS 436.72 / UBC 951) TaxID=1037660 RepID=A0A066VN20_TILAU|nr:putative DNA repair endonuclease rad2 [Tilletiaria anomala UBC 951]KDN41688.1 putative DNA repair endonuclease rad2 [Tilletiaria anomala UBC 951]
MGIKGLTGLLSDEAPDCIKEHDIKTYFGRKVAIDASMSLYQFLIAVRQQDGQQLMSESGETTSHLMGFFYRTLRMIDHGIKPMYVFDGQPPDLKKKVLEARFGKREEAREEQEDEKDVADAERMDQLARRQVRPTRQHNAEVRELLKLMGIPCVVAPSEAEAQCAELVRAGKVYGAGSEDMDTLTFGTPVLLKHLTFSEQKKMPVHEVNLQKALEGLGMEREQFVDLCILLGCDYLEQIKGIGPKTALKLIREHGTLAAVLDHLRGEGSKKSISIPEFWPHEEAKKLFLQPDVQNADDLDLKWEAPDVEGLVDFLCKDKGFSEDRVRKGAEKLQKSLGKKQQGRLDGFFTVSSSPASSSSSSQKRKAEDSKKGAGGGKKSKSSAANAKAKGKK